MNYIVAQAIEQAEAGAQILDVNVGLPDIDEPETMRRVVTAISGAVSLPLQIDSSSPKAIEAGLRVAPGKCMVNSVNASRTSLEAVLPIAKNTARRSSDLRWAKTDCRRPARRAWVLRARF